MSNEEIVDDSSQTMYVASNVLFFYELKHDEKIELSFTEATEWYYSFMWGVGKVDVVWAIYGLRDVFRRSVIGSLIYEIRRKKYKISEMRGKYFKKSESEQYF